MLTFFFLAGAAGALADGLSVLAVIVRMRECGVQPESVLFRE